MKHLLLFSVFLFFICACQKEIVEIPDTGRKIVINGLITTDSLINVRISKSYYFKDPMMGWGIFPEFDSAEVRFYKNDIYLDSLHYGTKRQYREMEMHGELNSHWKSS